MLRSEQALITAAAAVARYWRQAGIEPLLAGLRGPLGSGKTTWVRAMLRGLGYTARVPSPTYTLVEEYRVGGLTVVHLDLYRLAAADEIEFLGIRDRLGVPDVWLLVEWPERAGPLLRRCDLLVDFRAEDESRRELAFLAQSSIGRRALGAISELEFR
jgi:tRNA threonylcarbamoyladenosine biosynthesis protein TsaE